MVFYSPFHFHFLNSSSLFLPSVHVHFWFTILRLLLNHISSQGRCQLIFDSSDSVDMFSAEADSIPIDDTPLDMADLQACFTETAPAAKVVDNELEICAPFSDFLFQGWTPEDASSMDKDGQGDQRSGGSAAGPAVVPAALNVDADYFGDGSDDGGLDDMDLDQSFHEFNEGSSAPIDALFNMGPEDMEPADGAGVDSGGDGAGTRRSTRQLGLLEDNEFSWLQTRTNNKGWHGEGAFTVPVSAKAAEAKKAGTRAKKEKMQINFGVACDWTTLLGKTRASTVLTKTTLNSQEPNLLPEDHKYTLDHLTKLFLLPSVDGRTLVTGADDGDAPMDNDDDDVAPDGWGVEDSFGGEYASASSPTLSLNGEAGAADLFGMDDDDDGGIDLGGGDDDDDDFAAPDGRSATPGGTLIPASMPSALKLIENVKQTNKINITYAQKAKVMDVKKLKSSLWTEIDEAKTAAKENDQENTVPQSYKPALDDVVMRAGEKKLDLTDAQTFQNMYNDIPHKVDSKMAENMSVPIMFVCLLYLANDKELQINGTEGMDNLVIQHGV